MKILQNDNGFSYIEILIALAFFSIIFTGSLMVLNQSGRNLAYAREGYTAHLSAQRLMIASREAFENKQSLAAAISHYADTMEVEAYSVWVFNTNTMVYQIHTPNAPHVNFTPSGLSSFLIYEQSHVIVTVIWNEHGNISGRAIGTANRR
ncbi:MAG: hypothetical protein FWE05_10845 [Defluviitaleaceae bacterium]|nr:hypothetical protein [Defluviitaleaceae bacterium]